MFTNVLFWMPLEPSPSPPVPKPRKVLLQQKSRDKAFLDSPAKIWSWGYSGHKKKNCWVMYEQSFLLKGEEIEKINKVIFETHVSLAQAKIS